MALSVLWITGRKLGGKLTERDTRTPLQLGNSRIFNGSPFRKKRLKTKQHAVSKSNARRISSLEALAVKPSCFVYNSGPSRDRQKRGTSKLALLGWTVNSRNQQSRGSYCSIHRRDNKTLLHLRFLEQDGIVASLTIVELSSLNTTNPG
jgi:hypothetical protein